MIRTRIDKRRTASFINDAVLQTNEKNMGSESDRRLVKSAEIRV